MPIKELVSGRTKMMIGFAFKLLTLTGKQNVGRESHDREERQKKLLA